MRSQLRWRSPVIELLRLLLLTCRWWTATTSQSERYWSSSSQNNNKPNTTESRPVMCPIWTLDVRPSWQSGLPVAPVWWSARAPVRRTQTLIADEAPTTLQRLARAALGPKTILHSIQGSLSGPVRPARLRVIYGNPSTNYGVIFCP